MLLISSLSGCFCFFLQYRLLMCIYQLLWLSIALVKELWHYICFRGGERGAVLWSRRSHGNWTISSCLAQMRDGTQIPDDAIFNFPKDLYCLQARAIISSTPIWQTQFSFSSNLIDLRGNTHIDCYKTTRCTWSRSGCYLTHLHLVINVSRYMLLHNMTFIRHILLLTYSFVADIPL